MIIRDLKADDDIPEPKIDILNLPVKWETLFKCPDCSHKRVLIDGYYTTQVDTCDFHTKRLRETGQG